MMKIKTVTTVAVLAVAGCAATSSSTSDTTEGTSNATETVTLPATSYRSGSAGWLETYDSGAETVTFETQGNQTVVLNMVQNGAIPGWTQYTTGDFMAFSRESSTGETAVIVAIGPDLGGLNTTEYLRQAATEMPTTGTMVYTGEYVGLISIAGTRDALDISGGTAEIEADFANSTITGAVKNRGSNVLGDLPDAVFDLGRINGVGAISAVVLPESEELLGQEYNIDGVMHGVISGTDATEIGGSLYLVYRNPDDTSDRLIEHGSFIAEPE